MVRCTPEKQPSSLLQRAILLLDCLPWKTLLLAGSPERQRFASILNQLHLIHFYLFGEYSSFARRLSRSRYALLRDPLGMPTLEWSFKVIGIFLTIKLFRDLVQNSVSVAAGQSDVKEGNGDQLEDGTLACGLCRDPTCECTVTRCGHLFCWRCITEWVVMKYHCPLCRSPVSPEQLVRVINR